MGYTRSISRYYTLITLLTNQYICTSAATLAGMLHIRIEQIREDLSVLLLSEYERIATDRSGLNMLSGCYQNTGITISELLSADEEDGTYRLEAVLNETAKDRIAEDVSGGKLDDLPLQILDPQAELLCDQGHTLNHLYINETEMSALQEVYPSFITERTGLVYRIKSILPKLPASTAEYVRIIYEAIQLESNLQIAWKSSTGSAVNVINPAGLFQNMEDGNIYCISADGLCIPLRNIKSCAQTALPLTSPEQRYKKEDVECMWGIPSWNEQSPVNVKVLFHEGTSNLIRKIQSETRSRDYAKLQSREDGTWLYTDRVLGIDGFRRWLRGYGSAAVVLEPAWLADKMRASAAAVLRCYETGEFEW